MEPITIKTIFTIVFAILAVGFLVNSIFAGGIIYTKVSLKKSVVSLLLCALFTLLSLAINSLNDLSGVFVGMVIFLVVIGIYFLFGLLDVWIIENIFKDKK